MPKKRCIFSSVQVPIVLVLLASCSFDYNLETVVPLEHLFLLFYMDAKCFREKYTLKLIRTSYLYEQTIGYQIWPLFDFYDNFCCSKTQIASDLLGDYRHLHVVTCFFYMFIHSPIPHLVKIEWISGWTKQIVPGQSKNWNDCIVDKLFKCCLQLLHCSV